VFDTSQPLSQLRVLSVRVLPCDCHYCGLSSEQVQVLAACCAGLRKLELQAGFLYGASLAPLKSMSALTSFTAWSAGPRAIADVAQLQQLSALKVSQCDHISYKDCYPLVGLRGLTSLGLYFLKEERNSIYLQGPVTILSGKQVRFPQQLPVASWGGGVMGQ
jgi:hypothetical protein